MTPERLQWVAALGLLATGCTPITPAVPRFVAIYDQVNTFCRVQVIRDTRSAACFITFRCARQPVVVLAVDAAVCVP